MAMESLCFLFVELPLLHAAVFSCAGLSLVIENLHVQVASSSDHSHVLSALLPLKSASSMELMGRIDGGLPLSHHILFIVIFISVVAHITLKVLTNFSEASNS